MKIQKTRTNKNKQYWVQSAIYRMLRKKLINKTDAINLLQTRAMHKESMAKALVTLWITSYTFKNP